MRNFFFILLALVLNSLLLSPASAKVCVLAQDPCVVEWVEGQNNPCAGANPGVVDSMQKPVGTWIPPTSPGSFGTCKLNTDLSEEVVIEDSIILDGEIPNQTSPNNRRSITGSGTGVGILARPSNVTIRNIMVSNFEYGIRNPQGFSANSSVFEDNTVTGNDKGIYIHGGATNSFIQRNIVSQNNTFGITGGETIVGNIVEGNGTNGISHQGGNCTISGNTVINNKNVGIRLGNNISGVVVTGNTVTIDENNPVVAGGTQIGILLHEVHEPPAPPENSEPPEFPENSLSGNILSGGAGDGIKIEESDHVTVSDNTVTGFGTYGISCVLTSHSTFTGNTISDSGTSGIHLNWCQHNEITNNRMTNKENIELGHELNNPPAGQPLDGTLFSGNFWGTPDGTGYSQRCADVYLPKNICDAPLIICPSQDHDPLQDVTDAQPVAEPGNCIDNDGDGYSALGGTSCPYPGKDCDDDFTDDPEFGCEVKCNCNDYACRNYARCRHPGAKEFPLDFIDSDCSGLLPTCFIAKAYSGTPMEGKISVLRSFRDRYLRKSWMGEEIVNAYYKYSPPVARYISERGWFKALLRILLVPVIGVVSLFV